MNEWACGVDWPAAVGVVRDVVMTVAAIATATVAVIGLNAWRRQGRAKARFEVAKDFAAASLAVRDALDSARVPMISHHEYPPLEPGEDRLDARSGRVLGFVYENRWEPVKVAIKRFNETGTVAEAYFGDELGGRIVELRRLAHRVATAMNEIVDQAYQDNRDFEDRRFRQTVYADAHATVGAEDNELSQSLNQTVSDIQTLLRSSLTWRDA